LREMNYNSAMEGNGFHEISGKVNIDE